VINNTVKLQAVDQDINTCGRHVVSRFRFYKMGYSLHEYTRLFHRQKLTPDETVSLITLLL
jgi:hypothetical protein